jgi:hypothetical protein
MQRCTEDADLRSPFPNDFAALDGIEQTGVERIPPNCCAQSDEPWWFYPSMVDARSGLRSLRFHPLPR